VGDAGDCRRTIDEVISAHGRLDILVNNAGITIDKTVLKLSDEDWFKVLNVNLSGAFFLSQAALRHMAERGSGRIVNVSSVIGEMGNIGQANYAAAKAGVVGLSRTLSKELARNGITVNALCPGFIETDMTSALPAEIHAAQLEKIPLGRIGTPTDVGNLVAFLASDDASYITGEVINIGGGYQL